MLHFACDTTKYYQGGVGTRIYVLRWGCTRCLVFFKGCSMVRCWTVSTADSIHRQHTWTATTAGSILTATPPSVQKNGVPRWDCTRIDLSQWGCTRIGFPKRLEGIQGAAGLSTWAIYTLCTAATSIFHIYPSTSPSLVQMRACPSHDPVANKLPSLVQSTARTPSLSCARTADTEEVRCAHEEDEQG